MQTLVIILCVIVVLFIVAIAIMAVKLKNTTQNANNIETEEETANTSIVEYPYHRKYLLSQNEYKFYKALKPITDKYNLHILSKVRMEDIIATNGELSFKEKQSARGRIKSRHFDFVLTNPENLYVMCVIELDDNSHISEKAKASDEFKNKVCETVNLPIIRCFDINGVEEQICEKLKLIKI